MTALAPASPEPAGPARTRERLIEQHLPLVRALARRFSGAGEPVEDLVQVGAIGLIKAVDRYDAARGVPLEHYAASMIAGEIRHHLRDLSEPVRLPRRLREAGVRVRIEALDEDGPDDAEPSGDPLATAEDRLALADAARALHPRARRLVALCFEHDLSQSEAATALGMSRAQASRQLHDALRTMRCALAEATDVPNDALRTMRGALAGTTDVPKETRAVALFRSGG